ncbi:MAG: SpoIIE family protein phosphatase [Capsulimonadaceae bacterium]|nr:SpoIIE family protein phosphatase [Capsulimonadaceae bacterium]
MQRRGRREKYIPLIAAILLAVAIFATDRVLHKDVGLDLLYFVPLLLAVYAQSYTWCYAILALVIGLDCTSYALNLPLHIAPKGPHILFDVAAKLAVGLFCARHAQTSQEQDAARKQAEALAYLFGNTRYSIDWADISTAVCEAIGRTLDVDRVHVVPFENERGEPGPVRIYEWLAPNIATMVGVDLPATREDVVNSIDWEGQLKVVNDTRLNPAIPGFLLNHYNLYAGMFTKIFVNGRVAGLISVHDCRRPRRWSKGEMSLLASVSDQMSNVIEEAQLRRMIAEQSATIRFVFENAPIGIIIIERDYRVTRCNRYLADLCNMTVEELTGQDLKTVYPALTADNIAVLEGAFNGEEFVGRNITLRPAKTLRSEIHVRSSAFPIRDPSGAIHAVGVVLEDTTAEQNSRFAVEAALEREQRVNRTLQRSLVPSLPVRLAGVETCFIYRPAADRGVGGDFVEVFPLEGDRIALVIGDVTGHGVEAAAHTSLVRNLLRAYALIETSPAATINRVNYALLHQFDIQTLVTLFFGILTPSTGGLVYASAGHEPPAIYRGDDLALEFLDSTGSVVGVDVADLCVDQKTAIGPGDTMAMFTDGLVEARSRMTGRILGADLFYKCVQDCMHEHVNINETAERIWSAATGLIGTTDLDDDATLVLITLPEPIHAKGGAIRRGAALHGAVRMG